MKLKNNDISHNFSSEIWVFKLFVCGVNPKSARAYFNLKKVCDERLAGQYKIELVDLYKNPELAVCNNIVSCPTVVKELPSPRRMVIGDLSKTDLVVSKLDFPEASMFSDYAKGAKSVSFNKFTQQLRQVFDSGNALKFVPYANLK